MNGLTFVEYQEKTRTTAIYKNEIAKLFDTVSGVDNYKIEKLLNIAYVGLGLGEVGETQGKIKKLIRDSGGVVTDDMRNKIAGELGDILWYVSQTCCELDLSLSDVAQGNVEKLASRKERGVIQGSGDDR